MVTEQARVIQVEHQNACTDKPLILPILVLPNTPDEEIRRNIKINSARDLEWIKRCDPHEGVAVLVGGGGSIDDLADKIKDIKGATIFAMNGARSGVLILGLKLITSLFWMLKKKHHN